MRLTIDIDCTPEEARAFFGMPNVAPLNDMIMTEATRRARENLDTLADPDRFFAQMMTMGGKSFEQLQSLMGAAMSGAGGGAAAKKK